MKPEQTVDFHIRWAWQKISRMYNTEAIKHEFTMSIGYVLLNIDLHAGTPSTKLGPKMGMEPRSLTRSLKTMEKNGWIFRKADPADKRMVRIFLTDAGKEKREISRKTVIQFNKEVQKVVPPEKLNEFFSVISLISGIANESCSNPDKQPLNS